MHACVRVCVTAMVGVRVCACVCLFGYTRRNFYIEHSVNKLCVVYVLLECIVLFLGLINSSFEHYY